MAKRNLIKKKSNKEEKYATGPNVNVKGMKPKFRRKKRKASKPNPASGVSYADASKATTSEPANRYVGETSRGIEKEEGMQKQLSGFIFMCNPTTKLECFRYRVLGLPMGQKEVVEEVKPGAKLFLYDFELKLLYGVYEAISSGQLNLEPGAFGGRYPAQVKFRIFKECLPMSEKVLKQVIKENYNGFKFKQELHVEQVKKLLSSFQPLPAPSSLVSWAPLYGSQLPMPPPARENQPNHTVRVFPPELRYAHAAPASPAFVQSAHEVRCVHAAPAGRASIQSAHEVRYVHAGAASIQNANEARYVHAVLGPTPVPSAHAAPQGCSSVQIAQDERYVRAALQGSAPVQSTHARQQCYNRPAADLAQVHITLGHQSLPAMGNRYYVSDSHRPYFTESSAREVQQPSARAREERIQHVQVAIPGRQSHQLPSQTEPLYRDNAAGYNSYRHASATKYTSNVQVTQAPYAQSAVQPQVLASGTPLGLLHYYSHDRATR